MTALNNKYLGKYRGVVVSNIDPEGRGRITARVPDVYGAEGVSGYALPCLPFAGKGTGMYGVPPIGALVWIEFEQGDKDYPIWTGGFWESKVETPDPLLATSSLGVVLKTLIGSTVMLDDTPGKGGITLKSMDGSVLSLSAQGIALKTAFGDLAINATGVTLKTKTGQSLVLGKTIKLTNGVASLEMIGKLVRINGQSLMVL